MTPPHGSSPVPAPAGAPDGSGTPDRPDQAEGPEQPGQPGRQGQPATTSVLAVLVARSAAPGAPVRLGRVLAALDAQTRRPDEVVAVAAGCGAESVGLLRAAGAPPVQARRSTPAEAVRVALAAHAEAAPRTDPSRVSSDVPQGHPAPRRWLWVLPDDTAPEPDALAQLVAAAERRPDAAVVGPKVRDWDVPAQLLQAGFTTSPGGRVITGVDAGDLDQGQLDAREDVLAVGTAGMLVRADVLAEVGGFDPALPADGADLDLCRRVHRAGHAVVVAPAAVVERPARALAHVGGNRSADVHLRLAGTSALALPFAGLRELLAGVLRFLWCFAAKEPGRAPGELGAVLGVLLRPHRLLRSRRLASRNAVLPRSALRPLLAAPPEVRRARREQWQARRAEVRPESERAQQDGAHPVGTPHPVEAASPAPSRRVDLARLVPLTLVLAVASVVALRRLLGPGPFVAPALPAAPGDASDLWRAATSSWAAVGTGSPAAPDPFLAALAGASAVLGGSPTAVVLTILLGAVPLAGLAAWCAAGALTRARRPRLLAAVTWAAGPPLLTGLSTGRLGPVVAHLALPWLAWALLTAYRARGARRVWTTTGVVALALVPVVVGAPVLGLPAVLAVLVLAGTARRRLPLLAALLPTVTVVGPWVVDLVRAVAAGAGASALAALVGGPVPPVAPGAGDGWQVLLAQPLDAAAWAVRGWSLPGTLGGPSQVLLTALPLLATGALALAALVAALRRPAAVWGWALVLGGGLLALLAGSVATGLAGSVTGAAPLAALAVPAAAWAGPGTSLVLLGLLTAALVLLARSGAPADVTAEGAAEGAPEGAADDAATGGTGARAARPARRQRAARLGATAAVSALAAASLAMWVAGQTQTSSTEAVAAGLVARDRGPELPEVAAGNQAEAGATRTLVVQVAPDVAVAPGTGATSDTVADAAAQGSSGGAGAASGTGTATDAAGDPATGDADAEPSALSTAVVRGGVELDDIRSLAASAQVHPGEQPADRGEVAVSRAAADLVGGRRDAADAVASLGAGFVLLLPSAEGAAAGETSVAEDVDTVPGLARAGEVGGAVLWRVGPTTGAAGSAGSAGSTVSPVRLVAADGTSVPVDPSALRGSAEIPAGEEGRRLVLAESADPGWSAELDGEELPGVVVDGWAQAFEVGPGGGTLQVRHDGGWASADGAWPWAAGVTLLLALLLALPLPGRRTA